MSEPEIRNVSAFDEASVRKIIKESIGETTLKKDKDEFHQAILRLEKERTGLMEKFPDKWVAVGKAGVLAVADSMEDVFAEVESKGLSGSEFEVEFLDSNPPDLIL